MRIGIITQPLAHNYGGILQNYALQQVLIRMGHSPKTIDLKPRKDWGKRIKHIVWSYTHLRKPNKWFFLYDRPRFVKIFIRKNIVTTRRVKKYRADMVKANGFDALIAGSDQIWRPACNDYLFDMYFKFAESLPVKKIVYGASFGTDEMEYDLPITKCCRSLVQQINTVSVREKSGVELCRHYFGIEAQWVLDPTLLLEAEDYERICAPVPRFDQAFLAAYLLDINEQIVCNIKKIAQILNVPMRLFSTDRNTSLSIEGWLATFRDAKYVITDSFHGSVFSIIFNKPFVTVGNHTRGMSRFLSLLEQFGLEDRLSENMSSEVLQRPIQWERINSQRHILKERSIRFLERGLSCG